MKEISGKELCKILKQNGWELKTIKGSHQKRLTKSCYKISRY